MRRKPSFFTMFQSMFTKRFVFVSAFLVYVTAFFYPMPASAQPEDMESMGASVTEAPSSESWQWGDRDLDDAVSEICATLVQQGELKGKAILISPSDLYDAQSGLSLPLAILLRGKLIDEMTSRGVRVLLPGVDEERCMFLQGSWQKEREELGLYLKVSTLGPGGPEVKASGSAQVPLDEIDRELLIQDRESWARYLVRKLEKNTTSPAQWKVHLGPFRINSKACNPKLGGYLSGWIQPALAQSYMFVPLDQKRALRGLSVHTLRKRGTRAIRPNLEKPGEHVSLTADLMNADGEIKGTAWLYKDKIEVRVKVVSAQKHQHIITASTVDVPANLFPHELLEAPTDIPPPDEVETTGNSQGISKDGLVLDLTTTRGEGKAFYRDGERIRFVLRLNRQAKVYVFDLDPEGRATLLYPVDENGRLARARECGRPPEPGTPLIIPEDGCSYDLEVTHPYGKDTVWAVASEMPLKFPPDLRGDWQKGDVLIKRLREQGLSGTGGYAESQVEVVTGPR